MIDNQLSKDRKDLKSMIILFKTHQALVRLIKEDIKQYGFDLNEFSVLEVLYHHKQLKVQDINDKILVSSSSLSYILAKLEKKDLIKRNQDINDKRVFHIELSNHGKEISKNIFPAHYKMMKDVFNVLTSDEQELLDTLLKKVGYNAKVGGEKNDI